MAIVEMNKVLLFAHRAEKDALVRALQSLGLMEIRQIQDNAAWEEWGQFVTPAGDPDAINAVETRLGEVKYSLDFLARNFPVKKSFVQQFTGSKLSLATDEFATYATREEEVAQVQRACRKADEDLTALRNEETRTKNLLVDLSPYAGLPVPLEEVGQSKRITVKLGSIPVQDLPVFQEGLSQAQPEAHLEVLHQDRENTYLFFVALAGDPSVEELLKNHGWTDLSMPAPLAGTPAQVMESLEKRLRELEEERQDLLKQVEGLLEHRPLLMAYYDHLALERDRLAVTDQFARTEKSVLITGWVAAAAIPQLEQELAKVSKTVLVIAQEPGEGEVFPVALENAPLVRPFEAVTKLYSNPHYRELDPTPLLAPFFFVFFGIALGDAGYGILLSLLAVFLLRALQPKGMGEQLIKVLLFGGIATVGFGILSGGWFGDMLPIQPLWFDPLDDPMRMLIFSFILGIIQLVAGILIQAYRNIKAGKVLDALFDQGLWLVLLTGFIMFALPGMADIAGYVAIAGAVGLVLTQGRTQKNVVMKFLGGLLSLYNVTGYLSDVLSYSRLLALGLASGVIAVAINTMGRLVGEAGIIGMVIMVLLMIGGHAFNLIISTLGAYVHTSRLQYIEYFGKFFEGGGKAFTPFAIKTQYVEVEEREA